MLVTRNDSPPSPLGPLILRIGLGAVFLAHAYGKAFVFTFAGTAEFFAAHGFPAWTARPVFLAELLGGLALLAGFQTRLVALGLLAVIAGAIKPHLGNGWLFTNAGGGWEYPTFLATALVAQVLLGPGAYAVSFPARRRATSARAVTAG
jgi:putative oxidoreductase